MSIRSRLYTFQGLPAGKISVMPHPHGGEELSAEIKQLYYAGVDVLLSLLTVDEVASLDLSNEAEYCQREGIIFLSYPVLDRSVPPFTTDTFALLERLKTYLAQGKHVVVHCWMGLGRSPLIAASLLVLSGYTPEQACDLFSAVRGAVIPERPEQRAWIEMLSQQE